MFILYNINIIHWFPFTYLDYVFNIKAFSSSAVPASSNASSILVTFLATDCVSTFDLFFCKAFFFSASEINLGRPCSRSNSSTLLACAYSPDNVGKDRAKIRANNIIGPMCKVGGELTNNNFLGYSNKVHDGFLGHSYIGEWVNIGAGTNNSNLKNNYSLVKVRVKNKIHKTDLQFLGSLIGDYTRIAIGTNLNTGTFIGLGSNIFNHRLQE